MNRLFYYYISIVIYFIFNLLYGGHGIIELFNNREQNMLLDKKISSLYKEYDILFNKVNMFRYDKVDEDLLDEYARHNFGLIREDELVIFK